jgi:DNA-binding response OmpR family regulator
MRRPHTLVVTTDPLGTLITEWLTVLGHDTVLLREFGIARTHVDTRPPDLLVVDVRLGAFNGLHLVNRVSARGLPTRMIVVGGNDRALEAEAQLLGARYVARPLDEEEFLRVARLAMTSAPERPGIAGPERGMASGDGFIADARGTPAEPVVDSERDTPLLIFGRYAYLFSPTIH